VVTVQTPRRPFPCDIWPWKFLDIAIDEVLGVLSMHAIDVSYAALQVHEIINVGLNWE
jgi:hypothetical protein